MNRVVTGHLKHATHQDGGDIDPSFKGEHEEPEQSRQRRDKNLGMPIRLHESCRCEAHVAGHDRNGPMRTEGPLDSDFNTRPCLDFAERLPATNDNVNRIPRGLAD
ncbi:MAG TPA: hypothetical protein VLD18_15930, partial [Verrucomicrobiae bacterium]|nr:hypothetical protein [Verrucomicrobiae bacterium]